MNILSGFIQQTNGKINICNYDTRYHMDYLRQFISYCPQRMFYYFIFKKSRVKISR